MYLVRSWRPGTEPQVLEAAVERLCGAVAAAWSAKNASTSAARFFSVRPRVVTSVRQAGTAWGLGDQVLHAVLVGLLAESTVGGDQLLVDVPGSSDFDMVIVGGQRCQASVLPTGQ